MVVVVVVVTVAMCISTIPLNFVARIDQADHCLCNLIHRKCALAGTRTIAWRKVMTWSQDCH